MIFMRANPFNEHVTFYNFLHRVRGIPTVLFPRTGCEQLLGQVFNLGVESHDDLCDGLTTLLNGLVEQGLELPKIHWIET